MHIHAYTYMIHTTYIFHSCKYVHKTNCAYHVCILMYLHVSVCIMCKICKVSVCIWKNIFMHVCTSSSRMYVNHSACVYFYLLESHCCVGWRGGGKLEWMYKLFRFKFETKQVCFNTPPQDRHWAISWPACSCSTAGCQTTAHPRGFTSLAKVLHVSPWHPQHHFSAIDEHLTW